jgi:hypothetical protein
MFILYAIVAGLIVGRLSGGSFAGLAGLRIRWGPLVLAGLLVQVVLFSGPLADRVEEIGPLIYVCSTGAVLAAVLRNWRIAGLPLVALGAASNAAAILANGGFMPAAVGALAALGKVAPTGYSNSAVVAHPALEPLTDLFALPRIVPFANVFSIGDILIATGIAITLVVAMRMPVVPAPPAPPVTSDAPLTVR